MKNLEFLREVKDRYRDLKGNIGLQIRTLFAWLVMGSG
jgi:hypothetical protein